MSLEHEKKMFKITVEIFVYAPYNYSTNLKNRLEKHIRNTVARNKLYDVVCSFREVGKR